MICLNLIPRLSVVRVCVCLAWTIYAQSSGCAHTSGHGLLSATQVRRQIQALYDRASACSNHKDMKGYGRADAPDFKIIHSDGTTMTKAQMDQQVTPQDEKIFNSGTSRMTQTIQSIALQKSGRSAVVIVQDHIVFTVYDPHVKHSITYSIDEKATDTWFKTPQGWLRQSSREIAPPQFKSK